MTVAGEFTRAELCARAGISREAMKSLRRRGALDGLGRERSSGHWRYTQGEIEVFILAIELHRLLGLSIPVSLRWVRRPIVAMNLIDIARKAGGVPDGPARRRGAANV